MKETALVYQIIDWLTWQGHRVIRFNTGAARATSSNGREHLIRFGANGWPDIIGYEKGTGTMIAIECKVGRNKTTELQDQVGLDMQANNVAYVLAYSLDDVINYFDKREAIRASRLAA